MKQTKSDFWKVGMVVFVISGLVLNAMLTSILLFYILPSHKIHWVWKTMTGIPVLGVWGFYISDAVKFFRSGE